MMTMTTEQTQAFLRKWPGTYYSSERGKVGNYGPIMQDGVVKGSRTAAFARESRELGGRVLAALRAENEEQAR